MQEKEKKNRQTKRLNVAVPNEVIKKLKIKALESETKMSDFVTKIFEDYLEKGN